MDSAPTQTDGGGEELDRETLITEFSEAEIEHTEWWERELERAASVINELSAAVATRDDVMIASRSTSVAQNGVHEISLGLKVAGEPWEPEFDGELQPVYKCDECGTINAVETEQTACHSCSQPLESDAVTVRDVTF
jgi:rRNA maturation endonuclease Nob1